jgi:hypothetical protein
MYRNISTIPSFSACLSSTDELYLFADEYFSDVKNDTVSVWEDESVSFDVLSNDRIAGSKAEIANSSSVS